MNCRIYQTPGRIRVRLLALKSAIPAALIDDLWKLGGVKNVLASELTGSVVIYYDSEIRCSSSILRIFRRHHFLTNVIGLPVRRSQKKAVVERQSSLLDMVNDFLRKALRPGLSS